MTIARIVMRLMVVGIVMCVAVIAGAAWGGRALREMELAYTDVRHDLRLLDLNHGFSVVLSPLDAGVYRDFAWSPDGEFIAYAAPRERGTLPNLFVLDMRGEVRQLTSAGIRGGNLRPQWSPDGRRIAISSLPEGGSGCVITIIDVASGAQQPFVDEGTCGAFEWSPDGVYFSYDTQVFRVDTREVVYDTQGSSPQWSSDGRYMMFERYEQGASYIHVAQNDGRDESVLSDGQNALWMPDGRIVFARPSLAGSDILTSIWAVDAAGEGLTALTPDHYGVWSPDMRWAVALIVDDVIEPTLPRRDRTRLYLLNVDSMTQREIGDAEDLAGLGWRP